jgi:uncharacterized protein (DUF2235 family)
MDQCTHPPAGALLRWGGMRRLIVCCDGTWNTAEDETVTNVRRFANALADRDEGGHPQLTYYQPGVGTSGPLLARLLGGGAGVGLSRNVLDGYHWLATRYEPGDRIALFGFSRGAYTARSLAGMVSACGLIDTDGLDDTVVWQRIQRIYDRRYRRRDPTDRWRDGLEFQFDPDLAADIPLDLVGVWDTVGALGIPDYLGGWDPVHRYDFHDVTLNPRIRYGRHALAMDETRGPFAPTLWARPYAQGQDVAQVWFPGSHQDVGGGHDRMGLSDGALLWMVDEARATVGLGFNSSTVEQIRPDALDVLHDDDVIAGPFQPVVGPLVAPALEILLQPRPRAVPLIDPDAPVPDLHSSAYERHLTPSITGGRYRPSRVPVAGSEETVEVFADRPWNATGLFLEPGEYELSADGQWRSGTVAAGPTGTDAPLIAAVATGVTDVFRWVTGNAILDLPGARREVDRPWLSLIAVVAGEPPERIAVGAGTRARVYNGGYLYAYANDAWGRYADNQGSARLTVTRVATPTRGRKRSRRSKSRDEAPLRLPET